MYYAVIIVKTSKPDILLESVWIIINHHFCLFFFYPEELFILGKYASPLVFVCRKLTHLSIFLLSPGWYTLGKYLSGNAQKLIFMLTSLVAHMVKNLPAIQEIWVRSLGQEYPLENAMAAHLPCLENPMDRGAWRVIVHGVSRESDTTERLTLSLSNVKLISFAIFLPGHKRNTRYLRKIAFICYFTVQMKRIAA